MSGPAPLPAASRLRALDGLRGLALLGILLANILYWSGWALMTPAQQLALAGSEHAQRLYAFCHHLLVQNGVRFTYPGSMIDLALAGRCAGRTPAKRWVLASTIARKASRP